MLTGDMLRRSAQRFPNKAAIIRDDVRLGYAELDAAANRFANALLSTGCAKGAKVAIVSRNLPEYGIVFFGAARSGLVLVNVSILYAPAELEYVLDKSDSEILLFDAQFAEKIRAVAPRCPKIRHFVSIGVSDVPGAIQFPEFLRTHPSTAPDVDLDERDPFCMTYTGGTTGRPKGVLCNHRAREVTAHTVAFEEALDERDVVAIVTPLFHVAALNIMFQPAVLVGATCVFLTPWSAERFMETVARHEVTATFMVPVGTITDEAGHGEAGHDEARHGKAGLNQGLSCPFRIITSRSITSRCSG